MKEKTKSLFLYIFIFIKMFGYELFYLDTFFELYINVLNVFFFQMLRIQNNWYAFILT